MDIQQRVEIHKKFWHGEELKKIPASFRLGDYFFADKFHAAKELLKPGLIVKPDMIIVDNFLEDYERMYNEIQDINQTGFWTAEPFVGIPWMESIVGCPVIGGERSLTTEPVSYNQYQQSARLEHNPWFHKYMEFIIKLDKLSMGRFPIGQPITRGISDIVGAVLGQEHMIYEMYDNPVKIKKLTGFFTEMFLEVIEKQYEIINDFEGGYALGFYHIWTPDRCIWFQEDLSSLLSPGGYRNFIKPFNARISEAYRFNLVHLHPSSFHIIEDILEIKELKSVEVNKDIGGPSVRDMVPVFKKIIEKDKCLIIWGSLKDEDISVIKSELPSKRIFLNIVAEDLEEAKRLLSLL